MRGQKQFGNRLPYSAGTASAFFELPSVTFSFTGVAGFVGDARSFCGAVCPQCELCSFCYAEKRCRFCCYKPKCFNPRSRRRYAASGAGGKRSEPQILFRCLLTKQLFLADTPLRGVSTLFFSGCTLTSQSNARRRKAAYSYKKNRAEKYAALTI